MDGTYLGIPFVESLDGNELGLSIGTSHNSIVLTPTN